MTNIDTLEASNRNPHNFTLDLVSYSSASSKLGNYKTLCSSFCSVAHGIVVIVVGNGPGNTSSNPGQGMTVFHIVLIDLGKV